MLRGKRIYIVVGIIVLVLTLIVLFIVEAVRYL